MHGLHAYLADGMAIMKPQIDEVRDEVRYCLDRSSQISKGNPVLG